MKHFLKLFFAILLLLSFSCTVSTPSIDYNYQIDKSIMNEIHLVENDFLKSIIEKRYNDTNLFLAKSLHNNLNGIEQFYNTVNPILKNSKPTTRDDYYIKTKSISIKSKNYTMIASDSIRQHFTFKFDPIEIFSNKMFITLQKYTTQKNDYLLGFIYVKENDLWKINTFRLGVISVNRLDSSNWMDIAQSQLKNNEIFSSYLCAEVSNALRKPFPLAHYENDKQIQSSYEAILNRIQNDYKLPFVVNSIKTKPELFRTHLSIEGFGPMPIINYKSNIDLKNVSLLKKEANELANYFKKSNPNMKKYFELIVFRAYSKIPVATDITNDFYGLPVKL